MSHSLHSPGINQTHIDDFIRSTFLEEWNYLNALNLAPTDLLQASYDQILSNPDDVADGVNKVEMKFGTLFFGIFDSLIVKYRDDDSLQLMFYTDMHQPAPVIEFYRALRDMLGSGILADHKFSSFNEENKIKALSQGSFSSFDDELMHLWNHENFNFTLNYRIDPLKQFLFIVKISPDKTPDTTPRINGTILSIVNHNILHVLAQKAVKEQVTKENGAVKFIDYTFPLDPPEFKIFEEVRIRVFNEVKQIKQDIQTHLTYYSKYEIDTSKIIILCDKLAQIYGKDNYGDKELIPHELDMLEESELWTGRSWLFNTSHAIQDLSDKTQSTLYGVTITLTPDDGLCLHILAFNKMMDYHNLMQL